MSAGAIVSNSKTINTVLMSNKDKLKAILPKGYDIDRFVQIAWGLVRRNDRLLTCTPESVFAGIAQGAQLGLSFDPVLGQGFLVPYWNNKKRVREAQFQVGYRGLCQLAYRSEKILSVYSEIVHKDDKFEWQQGTEPKIIHVPNLQVDREKPEEWIAAYAVAKLVGGDVTFRVLSKSEIYSRRAMSKTWADEDLRPSSLWTTNEKDMWLKTPIRALAKILPQSTEERDAVRAAIEDEYRDAGVETPAMPELPAGAIEVEPEAVPAENENRVIQVALDRDTAYITQMPKKLSEQARLKDYATEMKSRKRWEMPAAALADFAEFAFGFGYEVKEAKPEEAKPLTEADKKDWDIGI